MDDSALVRKTVVNDEQLSVWGGDLGGTTFQKFALHSGAASPSGLNMIKSRQALQPGGNQWTNTILVAVFMFLLLLAIGWYFDRGPR